MNNKIRVLLKITTEFEKNNICWGVGGSLLLFFKNITDFYRDIDLIVDKNDIEKANRILNLLGDRKSVV